MPENEEAIAYSPQATRQVLLRAFTLKEMMASKTRALVNRGEIRDAYDLEFLVKRGIPLVADREILQAGLHRLDSFSVRDSSVKLGSLLEKDKRTYYRDHKFRILKTAIIYYIVLLRCRAGNLACRTVRGGDPSCLMVEKII